MSRKGKLDMEKATEIRRLYRDENYTYKKLSEKYGVSIAAIAKIVSNVTWTGRPQKEGYTW